MANYIVEIGDEEGNSFKVSVSVITTLGAKFDGNWRTMDKGSIRYNSGEAWKEKSNGDLTVMHLLLLNSNNKWGIKLKKFHDMWGANDQGKGYIVQPWVLDFTPGRISWALVE